MGYIDTILNGDVIDMLRTLPDQSVNTCVTSPPYWGLRDYGVDGQLGLEKTPDEYVAKMVRVFQEVKRVLKDDGTLWLNLGDSYCGTGSKGDYVDPKYSNGRNGQAVALNNKIAGLKPKDLIGIPWRVAFALQQDGWYLRSDIIWHKPNPMPESVKDRPTKSHEYIFLMSKSQRYYYDADGIREICGPNTHGGSPGNRGQKQESLNQQKGGNLGDWDISKGRNKRSVWTVPTMPFKEAHFATFPPDLIKPCIIAGCPQDGIVLDPFMGSGTTAVVAKQLFRHYIGCELNPEYIEIAEKRIRTSVDETMSLFSREGVINGSKTVAMV